MYFPWKSPEPSGKQVMIQAKPCVAVAPKFLSSTYYNNAFLPYVPQQSSEDHLSLVAETCFAICQWTVILVLALKVRTGTAKLCSSLFYTWARKEMIRNESIIDNGPRMSPPMLLKDQGGTLARNLLPKAMWVWGKVWNKDRKWWSKREESKENLTQVQL